MPESLVPPALLLVLASLSLGSPPALAGSGGLTPEALWRMVRLSDPAPSPDGKQIVFVAREFDLESGKSVSSLWRVPSEGGEPVRLTNAPYRDTSPRWLPDGRSILFMSNRSGSAQIWALERDGGEPYPLSDLPVDVGLFLIAPDGSRLLFTADVFPDCTDLDCTARRAAEQEGSGVSGRIYTELLFRHWDTWEDGRRSHLFIAPLLGPETGSTSRRRRLGAPVDLVPGFAADVPTHPFGGAEEIAFSPDGKEIIFAAKLLPGSEAAWSTDVDLFRVPTAGGAKPVEITVGNPALDTNPVFSPDGRRLAWLAMQRPGFESDRQRIMIGSREGTGNPSVIAGGWDRSVSSLAWAPDGALVVTAEEAGRLKIFRVDPASGKETPLVEEHHNTAVSVTADGKIVFLQDSAVAPAVLMSVDAQGGAPRRLASFNDARLAEITMSAPRETWFKGARGEKVHAWLFPPVGYRKGEKYPVAYLVHGGPQGAWVDQFHYRWNPQIYAAAGYMTMAVNFHGSTGYGQAFTDSISGDWGGAPYEDLMKGLDHLLATEPEADGSRMCALGASYGGYMINWMAGHTDRFHCLVNHDGVFDERAAYYTTEELWFPEWEYGGPPWEKPEMYDRFTPSAHVERWKTPMLVIHGGLDFRLPETEAFATFTALRRRGIPAKLLHFPNENHWVLKPKNALLWHATVLDWLAQWTGAAKK